MIEYDKDAIVPPYITKWLRDNTKEEDTQLIKMREYAKNNGVPIAEPETAKFLSVITSIIKPEKVLEIGTAIGYSSIVMARAMGNKGKIITLEYSEEMVGLAKENINEAGLEQIIDVREADAKDYLSYFDEDGWVDMIFLDGPKAHYYYMLDDCVRLLKSGGVLISDNVLYKGMTADDNHIIRRKATIVDRLRDYIDALVNHKELETTLLPLGDGVTVSIKKG